MLDPFRMTVTPLKFTAPVGSTGQITVIDTGTEKFTVLSSVRTIDRDTAGLCKLSNTAPSWATVTPHSAVLDPGGRRTFTFHVNPGASPGIHDLAIIATADIGTGAVKVNASIGAQAAVDVPGHVAKGTLKPCTTIAAPPKPAGIDWEPVAGIGVIVALVVALFVMTYRLAHKRGAHHG